MRDLHKLLLEVKQAVPSGNDFHHTLDEHISSLKCMAPELAGLRFKLFAQDMDSDFGPDATTYQPWQFDVIRIWLGRPELTNEQIIQMG
jgi:hypothetical protein